MEKFALATAAFAVLNLCVVIYTFISMPMLYVRGDGQLGGKYQFLSTACRATAFARDVCALVACGLWFSTFWKG